MSDQLLINELKRIQSTLWDIALLKPKDKRSIEGAIEIAGKARQLALYALADSTENNLLFVDRIEELKEHLKENK